jgi:hypothetical protein
MPLEGEFGSLCHRSIRQMPSDRKLAYLFEVSRLRRRTPVRPVPTGPMLLHLRLRFFGVGFVDQPRNLLVFW